MAIRQCFRRTSNEKDRDSISGTLLQRLAVVFAIRVFGRCCRHSGRVIFLNRKVCVKYGRSQRLTEARTLRFIATHSSLPVPKVYCAFTHQDYTYIVMEHIHGEIVGKGWLNRSESSRKRICEQLRIMVNEMRQIQRTPASLMVNAVDGGPIFDQRLPWSEGDHGPFANEHDFHLYLRGGHDAPSEPTSTVQALAALQEETSSAVCFTHGDLSSANILVSGDVVVGFVDWESAGWYPSYWEYVNAWHVNPQNTFWQVDVDNFLEQFPRELEMDKFRRKYFGDY